MQENGDGCRVLWQGRGRWMGDKQVIKRIQKGKKERERTEGGDRTNGKGRMRKRIMTVRDVNAE